MGHCVDHCWTPTDSVVAEPILLSEAHGRTPTNGPNVLTLRQHHREAEHSCHRFHLRRPEPAALLQATRQNCATLLVGHNHEVADDADHVA